MSIGEKSGGGDFQKGRIKTGGRQIGNKNKDAWYRKVEKMRKNRMLDLFFYFNEVFILSLEEFQTALLELKSSKGNIMKAAIYGFVGKMMQDQDLGKWEFIVEKFFFDRNVSRDYEVLMTKMNEVDFNSEWLAKWMIINYEKHINNKERFERFMEVISRAEESLDKKLI